MKIDLKVETLKQSWVFRDLDEKCLMEIASMGIFHRFQKGEYLFHQGDPSNIVYIISSGKVKQFKRSSSGRPFTTSITSVGDPVNVMTIFGFKSTFVSAQAISDVQTIAFERKDFLAFAEKHSTVLLRLLHGISTIVNTAYDRLSDLVGETAYQRVINVLQMLYRKFGNSVSFTRAEIADLAGTTPETTVRVLGRLRSAGTVETKRGKIVVLDEVKLRDICQSSYKAALDEGPDLIIRTGNKIIHDPDHP